MTASWRLTDLVEWLTALGYDFGPDGPPTTPPRTRRGRLTATAGRAGQAIDAEPPAAELGSKMPSPSGAGSWRLTTWGAAAFPPVTTIRRRLPRRAPGAIVPSAALTRPGSA